MLWFASNLLFLHYQSQLWPRTARLLDRCDLLRIYYFCTINHSYTLNILCARYVVICFEFIIFALSITAMWVLGATSAALWFASNLLFLHYQSQHAVGVHMYAKRCDLLRIYYFCTINHSDSGVRLVSVVVVICFEFIIFALSITARCPTNTFTMLLWFASNLLFLHYQSQLGVLVGATCKRCDLLRIYYFCTINHSAIKYTSKYLSLWFASNLLFLHYQSQPSREERWKTSVVICFEFIIFALSITAIPWTYSVRGMLWFASNLLFLHYQSQQICSRVEIINVVICFEFIIFALSITACQKRFHQS